MSVISATSGSTNKIVDPGHQKYQQKKGWQSGSRGRVPALQARGRVQPLIPPKKKKKTKMFYTSMLQDSP
jgi:hypothetical protein